MRLAVLTENHTINNALEEEYGLCVYLEQGSVRLLFDTGYYGACISNASAMGLSFSQISAVAFSHNHKDHCGGFLQLTDLIPPDCPVYAHTGFFRRKWWDHRCDPVEQDTYEKTLEYVGPPFSMQELYQRKVTGFRLLPDDIFSLGSDVFLLGNFPVPSGTEAVHPSSVMEGPDGELLIDTFRDEQVCVVQTSRGLVVLTGCAHNGIINILETVRKRFPGQSIYAVLGGTHLVPPNPARIEKTVQYFQESGISIIGACHCTGPSGIEMFSKGLATFVDIGSGYVMDIC